MDNVKAMNNLEEILKDLGVSEELIHPNALIHRDLQLDSTEIVEVSLALKHQLGVKVKLETRQDRTLTEICTLIEEMESQSSI